MGLAGIVAGDGLSKAVKRLFCKRGFVAVEPMFVSKDNIRKQEHIILLLGVVDPNNHSFNVCRLAKWRYEFGRGKERFANAMIGPIKRTIGYSSIGKNLLIQTDSAEEQKTIKQYEKERAKVFNKIKRKSKIKSK